MLIVHINAEEHPGLPHARLEAAVRHTLAEEEVTAAEISVSFLDDDEIREMNRKYLERDRVTDVIAFTLGTAAGVAPEAGEAPPPLPFLVGDIYIGVEQADRQAEEMGIPREEELVRLAIHGTLHVLGHDHPEGEGREESDLFRRQEALVRAVMAGAADGPAAAAP